MANFNNMAYSDLVAELLNDAIYLKDRSKRGIISTVRQYAEVVVRRILDIDPDDQVTLGNSKMVSALKAKSNDSKLLMDAVENIRVVGNKCTHTQELGPVTEEDIDSVFDSLFDIYAYLFVEFFTVHKFGRNAAIISSFSILPPLIRYKALKSLYEADGNNISIIDKYSLSILKAVGVSEAKEWVLERKKELLEVPAYTVEGIEDIRRKFGDLIADQSMRNAPNMYDCCMGRLCEVDSTISKNGVLYNDFESAMGLFSAKGFVEGDSIEVVSFNDLMQFVYLGRRPSPNDRLDKSYITISE
ncbi:hypothetical protein GWQ44_09490 [Pseudomonas sp. 3MA1]|uniref:hypothetical protein n=1 Tax=Pseudomonas sp. 3MA1 TaxID=2699196 RepID=UPI0023DD82B2|nr:hypothetical protein [Pseudomonas sp. 3MA1]MDF2395768.1 hypothetical protein [Pseudomonas sp. 3MA1]